MQFINVYRLRKVAAAYVDEIRGLGLHKQAAAAANMFRKHYNNLWRVSDPLRRYKMADLATTAEYRRRLGEALVARAGKSLARHTKSANPLEFGKVFNEAKAIMRDKTVGNRADIAAAMDRYKNAKASADKLAKDAIGIDKQLAKYLPKKPKVTTAKKQKDTPKFDQNLPYLGGDPMLFLAGAGTALTGVAVGRGRDE